MAERVNVRTTPGRVSGTWEGGVAVFRGVPFGTPPVGPHRFAAPARPEPWDGVRGATAFGPPPPNPASLRVRRPGGPPTPTRAYGDPDDWLTLAVWTPDPGAAGLPVIVWVSGGGYLQCDTADPYLDGAAPARAGAVVVSAHYRTGVEGFAHLEGAPANRGLLDQLAALEWVRENVAAFGGDPDRVTVVGQSAGAGSIAALLVMPAARGLFGRAVVQSVPGTYFTPALAADIATEIAAEVGRAPRAADLAEVAPADLVPAYLAVRDRLPQRVDRWGPVAHTPTPFSPVVDGDVLPAAPWAAPRGDVDLLVAHTRDEFRLLAAGLGPITDAAEVDALIDGLDPGRSDPGRSDPARSDPARVDPGRVDPGRVDPGRVGPGRVDPARPRPGHRLGPGAAARPVTGPGATAYRAAYPDATAEGLREVALSDWLMRMPTVQLADAAHAAGARVWLAELTWGFGPQGASHGLDTLLVFGTADITGEITAAGLVEQASALGDLMRAEYLAFAATGDPGWDPYTPDERLTRVHDVPATVAPYPEERSRRLWRDHPFGVLDLV